MSGTKTRELTINEIITHGKSAAVCGEVSVKDGRTFSFADFYLFSGAKADLIKSITSYVIEIK
jgi:hypothetical protein